MPVWQPVSDQSGEGAGARVRRGAVPRSGTRSERRPPPAASGTDTLGGTLSTLSALPAWQGRLAMMAACTLPGVLMRLSGFHLPPPLAMVVFGGAVMAAAFMLASAAEAAELDVSPGIAVAGIAFVAVLPEYVIEVYFAFSGQVEFVTASLTGSTRLLLAFAVGMPALASFVLVRRGKPRVETVEIDSRRRIDLGIICAASLYAPLIALRGHLAWQDSIVLIGLYVVYMRRIASGDPEPPHLVGIAAELGKLQKRQRRRWVVGLMVYAAVAVLVTAEPFAHSVLLTGTTAGISPYLLVQWLVPLATEMPELVIAFVLVTHGRAGQAVAVLLSSAVSQWTFALGTLPLAFMAGAGQGPLPLLAREQVEILLTMGQGLLAVALLVTLRLGRRDAILMLVLFAVQLAIPSVAIRAAMTLGYLVLAIDVFMSERWAIPTLARALRARSADAAP
jgi:cation:H+ antiporter